MLQQNSTCLPQMNWFKICSTKKNKWHLHNRTVSMKEFLNLQYILVMRFVNNVRQFWLFNYIVQLKDSYLQVEHELMWDNK